MNVQSVRTDLIVHVNYLWDNLTMLKFSSGLTCSKVLSQNYFEGKWDE